MNERHVTASGIKDRQRSDDADRLAVYRRMRRSLDIDTPVTTDVDQVEWVKRDGRWCALAVFELTQRRRYEDGEDYGPVPPSTYFQSIVGRYRKGAQADIAITLAHALGCPVYLVVYNDDASLLWGALLQSTETLEWRRMTAGQFEQWLLALRGAHEPRG